MKPPFTFYLQFYLGVQVKKSQVFAHLLPKKD